MPKESRKNVRVIINATNYLMPKDIANYFGVSLTTVRRWVKNKQLKSVETIGGHSRIIAKDFYRLIKSK